MSDSECLGVPPASALGDIELIPDSCRGYITARQTLLNGVI